MKQAKIRGLFLVILIIAVFSSTTSAFATPSDSVEIDKSWNEVTDVIVNGEKIGDLNTSFKYERHVDKENTAVVNLTVSKNYELLSNATDIQRQEIVDETNSYEFKVTENEEFFVNGEQLTEEELNTPISSFSSDSSLSNNSMRAASTDRGGLPHISHYYGDYTNYAFGSYSDLNIMGGAQGTNYQGNGKITNPYVQRAMTSIDAFQGTYTAMNFARESFVIASGLSIVTVAGLVTAIAAGTALATSAATCYDAFMSSKSYLQKTVGYIQQM